MEGDTGMETEKQLTSTSTSSLVMGKLLSTTNKEEKNDSNDTVPTSSTDASTSSKSTHLVSDDIISSTSSEADASKTKTIDSVDNSSVTFEAELLGMSMKQQNEKIEENVDDLVNDLETLLGEPNDDFIFNRKNVDAKKEKTDVSSHDDIVDKLEDKLDDVVSSNTETAAVAIPFAIETGNIDERCSSKVQDSAGILETKDENQTTQEIDQKDVKISETTSNQADVALDSRKENFKELEVIEFIQQDETLKHEPAIGADLELSAEKCEISIDVDKQELLCENINEEQTEEKKNIIETESGKVGEQSLPSTLEETKSEELHPIVESPQNKEEKTEGLLNKHVEDTSGIVQEIIGIEESVIDESIGKQDIQIIESPEIVQKDEVDGPNTTSHSVEDVETMDVSGNQITTKNITTDQASTSEESLVKDTIDHSQKSEENYISEDRNEENIKPDVDQGITITDQIESVVDDSPNLEQSLETKTQEPTISDISAKLEVSKEKCSISMEVDDIELKEEAEKSKIEASPSEGPFAQVLSEEVPGSPIRAKTVSDPSIDTSKIGDVKVSPITMKSENEDVSESVVEIREEREPENSESSFISSYEVEEKPTQENDVVQELETAPENVSISEKPEETTREAVTTQEDSLVVEELEMEHEDIPVIKESGTAKEDVHAVIEPVEEISQENVDLVEDSEVSQKDATVAGESQIAQGDDPVIEELETVLENTPVVEESEEITQDIRVVEVPEELSQKIVSDAEDPGVAQEIVPVGEDILVIEEIIEEDMTENDDFQMAKDAVVVEEPEEISEERVSLVEPEITHEEVAEVEEPEQLSQQSDSVVEESEVAQENIPVIEEISHRSVVEEPGMTQEDVSVAEDIPVIEEISEENDTSNESQSTKDVPIVEEPGEIAQESAFVAEFGITQGDAPVVEEPKTKTQECSPTVEESEAVQSDMPVIEQPDENTEENVPVVEQLEIDQEEASAVTELKTDQEDALVVEEPEIDQKDVPEQTAESLENISDVKAPEITLENEPAVVEIGIAQKDVTVVEKPEESTQESIPEPKMAPEDFPEVEEFETAQEEVPLVDKPEETPQVNVSAVEEHETVPEDVSVVEESDKIQENTSLVDEPKEKPEDKPNVIQEEVPVLQNPKEKSETTEQIYNVVAESEIIQEHLETQEVLTKLQENVPTVTETEQNEDIEMTTVTRQKDIVVEKDDSSKIAKEKQAQIDDAKKTCEGETINEPLTGARNIVEDKQFKEESVRDNKTKETLEETKLVSEINIRRKTVEQDLEKVVCLSEESSDSDISGPASRSFPKPIQDLPQYDEESTSIRIAEEVNLFVDSEESMSQIDNLLSVPKEAVELASNFETEMAVASLQNEIISESLVERRLSEKEIREMEAIRMAVASITDSSQDNSYDSYLVENTMPTDCIQEFVSDDIEDTKSAEDITISEVETWQSHLKSDEVLPEPEEKEMCKDESEVTANDVQEQITENILASSQDVFKVEPSKVASSDSAQVDLIEDTNGANSLRKRKLNCDTESADKGLLGSKVVEVIEELVTSVVEPTVAQKQHEEGPSAATVAMNKSPVEQVEEADVEQAKDADVEQVKEAAVGQFEEGAVGQVKEAPVEQAEVPPVGQVKEAPVEQVEEAPVEQVGEAPVEQVEEAPVEQVGVAPVEQVGESSVEQVEEAPVKQVEESLMEQAEEAPVEQVEEASMKQAEEAPVEQVEEAPTEQAEKAPVEQVEEASVEQVKEAPAEPIDKSLVEQVKEAPPHQVGEAPPEQVEEAPSKQVEEAPPQQVGEAPPEQVEEAPPEQVGEASPKQVEEASVEQVEKAPAVLVKEAPVELVNETTVEKLEKAPAGQVKEAPVEQVKKGHVKQVGEVSVEQVAEEKPKRTRRNKVSEPLSINVEEVDKKEKVYSPKITIKAIKAPDEEVSTTSAEADANKGSLKITITKQSDKMHSILKVYDPEDEIEAPQTQEEPIRKLIIKPKMQQVEQQHSPKMSTRSSKAYSPTSTRCSSPRITIKPVPKPVTEIKTDAHSPLKITLKSVIKPEEAAKKLSPKPSKDQEQKNNNPKITIKPIPKPVEEEKEEVPKITIKAIKRHLEEDGTDVEQGRSSPKVTIKPVVKPQEEYELTKLKLKPIPSLLEKDQILSVKTLEDEVEEEVKERIVLKINKGNLPSPVKDSKKREYPEDEKLEKVAIKLKFSTTGGTTHIVQDGEETSNKRQRKDSGYSASTKCAEGNSPKRPLEEKVLEKNKRFKNNAEDKNEDSSDAVKIVETKLDSPIVISEDSRSQHSGDCIILDDSVPDISKIANIASSTTHIGVTPVLTVGVATPITTPTPSPRKRGRPRKAVLQIREEFSPAEASPTPSTASSVSEAGTGTPEASPSPGGRPKRSCRGQNATAILGLKPRKPRGGGRGRGGKVNMGDREPPAVAQAAPSPPVVAPPIETVAAKPEKVKKVKSQKKKKKSRRKSKLK